MGGRAKSAAGVGRIVRAFGGVGVVLFVHEDERHVWTETGIVRRAKASATSAFAGEPPDDLVRIAADAKVFATLNEGEPVRFESATGVMSEGTLIEKCRYGALVAAADGKIMAVGFRKLWPMRPGVLTS